MKKILTLVGAALAAKLAFEFFKSRTTPAPQPAGVRFEPAPRPPVAPDTGRHAGEVSTAPTPLEPNDLTLVTGIGPVYAGRLNDLGVSKFSQLASADPAVLASGLGLSVSAIEDWQRQASALDV